MKKAYGILILLATTLVSFGAQASNSCAPCVKASELIQRIEQSGVKPEPLNEKTIEEQNRFIEDASKILHTILVQANFGEAHAESALRLILKIIPYDNGLFVFNDNALDFQRLYRRSPLLKNKMEVFIKAGTMKKQERSFILSNMGLPVGK